MASAQRRISVLGLVSLLLAIAALVALYHPIGGYGAVPVAAAALGLGAVSFLLSAASARVGSGVPVLAALVSLTALGVAFHQNGQLDRWLGRSASAATPPPAPAVPAEPRPGGSTAVEQPEPPHPGSIFDIPGSSGPAANSSVTPRPVEPAPTLPPASPTRSNTAGEPPTPPAPSLAAARARLSSAMAAVEQRLAADPEYQRAKADADAAESQKNDALKANGPGSPEVLAASQHWLDARAKLQKRLNAAAATDPAVQSAQQDLLAAQAAQPGKH